MAKEIPQILKGFRDYLPQQQLVRRKTIVTISETFERFGFSPMDTPSLEPYELFQGKLGEDEKLMYQFEDLGNRRVALRYDLTVPLSRVYAANADLPKPFKRYQIGNVWRADKPQKGRFREFTQCDVDIIGSSSVVAEAEVIAALMAALQALGVGAVEVKYNNRALVDAALKKLSLAPQDIAAFMRALDKLDKLGRDKVLENLAAAGISAAMFDEYGELMDKAGREYAAAVEPLLSGMGITDMRFDKYLMRGLDYYTGIVFEFALKAKPEFGSIAGGGRYDNLIGQLTGVPAAAVGGSIGLDRLLSALEEMGGPSRAAAAEVVVFNLEAGLIADYLKILRDLRAAGFRAEFYYEPTKLDKQFKYAEAKNAKLAVIMGPDEAAVRKVQIKNLKEKEQVKVDLEDLITQVKTMLR